jgi:hypothetical protein
MSSHTDTTANHWHTRCDEIIARTAAGRVVAALIAPDAREDGEMSDSDRCGDGMVDALDALLEAGASVRLADAGGGRLHPLLHHWVPFRLRVEPPGWPADADAEQRADDAAALACRKRWVESTGAGTVLLSQLPSRLLPFAMIVAARGLGRRVVMLAHRPPPAAPGAARAAVACDAIICVNQGTAVAWERVAMISDGRRVLLPGDGAIDPARPWAARSARRRQLVTAILGLSD